MIRQLHPDAFDITPSGKPVAMLSGIDPADWFPVAVMVTATIFAIVFLVWSSRRAREELQEFSEGR